MAAGMQKKSSLLRYLVMPEDTTPTGALELPQKKMSIHAGWLKMIVWFVISILTALAIDRLCC